MARISTTPDIILTAIVNRIISQVDGATSSNTYISTISNELPPNPAEVMFEISFAHNFATFDGEFTGAGNAGLHTQMTAMVTISTVIQRDEVGRDAVFLTDADQGMLQWLTKVLAALSNHDLLDGSGNQILAEPLRLTQGQIPPKDDRRRGFATLMMECSFDWDLTGV